MSTIRLFLDEDVWPGLAVALRERGFDNAIAQALNGSVDLDQALHAALAQVAELLDLRTG